MMIRRDWPNCCYDRITEMASGLGRQNRKPCRPGAHRRKVTVFSAPQSERGIQLYLSTHNFPGEVTFRSHTRRPGAGRIHSRARRPVPSRRGAVLLRPTRGRDSAGQQSAPTTGKHVLALPRMNPPCVRRCISQLPVVRCGIGILPMSGDSPNHGRNPAFAKGYCGRAAVPLSARLAIHRPSEMRPCERSRAVFY